MDPFQTDEFRPAAKARPVVPAAPLVAKRRSYPYTTAVLAVAVAVTGGVIVAQLSGTAGFGWAAAAWIVGFLTLVGRVITALANRIR